MSPRANRNEPALPAAETAESARDIENVIARIDGMTVEALRSEWRRVFGSDPPPAFSKDLLARALCHQLQERALGRLKPAVARMLRALSKPAAEPPRQVKAGSVIVREHKGVLHEVMVTPGGFCWRGETYASLSTIARKITGVSWNGPRFFGLRSRKQIEGEGAGPTWDRNSATGAQGASAASADRIRSGRRPGRRPGRRSSLRPPVHASGERP